MKHPVSVLTSVICQEAMLGERWRYKALWDAPNIFISENNKQKYFLSSRNFDHWPVLKLGCISVHRHLGAAGQCSGRQCFVVDAQYRFRSPWRYSRRRWTTYGRSGVTRAITERSTRGHSQDHTCSCIQNLEQSHERSGGFRI